MEVPDLQLARQRGWRLGSVSVVPTAVEQPCTTGPHSVGSALTPEPPVQLNWIAGQPSVLENWLVSEKTTQQGLRMTEKGEER